VNMKYFDINLRFILASKIEIKDTK